MKLSDLFEARKAQDIESGEHDPWLSGKWAAKNIDKDVDPVKASYELLFADAFKTFPAPLRNWFHQRGYGVGGNGVFDMHLEWADFGEPFEETFCSQYGDIQGDPETMHADLIEFSKSMSTIYDTIVKMKDDYDKFHELTKKPQSLAKLQRGYKAQKGLQIVVSGSQRLEFFSFDGGHSGKVDHAEMPIFLHVNGQHEKYPTKPTRVPYFYDTDWFFDYIWTKLRYQFGIFDLLTDRVLSAKTKVKAIVQPTQPTAEELSDWFGAK